MNVMMEQLKWKEYNADYLLNNNFELGWQAL